MHLAPSSAAVHRRLKLFVRRQGYLSRMWVLVLVSNNVEIGWGLCGTSGVFRVGIRLGNFSVFFSLLQLGVSSRVLSLKFWVATLLPVELLVGSSV